MPINFLLSILLAALCTAQTSKVELRPSFSYLTFASSLATSPSNVVVEGSAMYVLAKKCTPPSPLVPQANSYVFLERELDRSKNPEGRTYQKRNYNPKSPLLLNGLTPHGFTIMDGELSHVVASNPNTKALYVLTMSVKYISR